MIIYNSTYKNRQSESNEDLSSNIHGVEERKLTEQTPLFSLKYPAHSP